MKIDAKKITALAAQQCLSVKELANRTGLSVCTLSRILNSGTSDRNLKTVGCLAVALGVSVSAICSSN